MRARLGLALAFVALWAAPSHAEDNNVKPAKAESALDSGVDSFAGEFTTRYAFALPSYRGLEPKLGLQYRASDGDGFVGIGWDLAGTSTIRRAGPRRSVPTYSAKDSFVLDGEELIGCSALGGSHCTKRQTFERIRFVAAENAWYAWRKDGTELRYGFLASSRYATARGTYAWRLDRKRDTHGNVVTYSYAKEAPSNTALYCAAMYLDEVRYNGVTIKLYREPRGRAASVTNGACLMEVRHRLKSVDILVASSRARVYRLGYAASPSSGRSRLRSLKQYGKDALVDATGEITNASTASALPAVSFAYHDNATPSFGGAVPDLNVTYRHKERSPSTFCGPENIECYTEYNDYGLLADVDGDGRADMIKSSYSQPFWATNEPRGEAHLIGRQVQLARRDATFGPATAIGTCSSYGGAELLVGDMDGNGRADLVTMQAERIEGGSYRIDGWIQYGRSDGTFTACREIDGLDDKGRSWRLADVNGDGLQDIFQVGSTIYINRGTLSFTPTDMGAAGSHLGDANGDGIADLWFGGKQLYLGRGDGTVVPTAIPISGLGSEPAPEYEFGQSVKSFHTEIFDLNGDGLEDFTRVTRTRSCYTNIHDVTRCSDWSAELTHVALNQGGGVFELVPGATGATSAHAFTFNDVDGDGLADRMAVSGTPTLALTRGATADLIAELHNGIGGATKLQYTGIARFDNTFMPLWQQVVTTMTNEDGRGWTATTRFDYAGAKWDAQERRFLGFARAKVIDPSGAYRETFYTQHVADAANTPRVDRYHDAAGNLMLYEELVRARSGDGVTTPYTSLVVQTWHYACNGDTTCKRSLAAASHDVYGNVTMLVEHGDYDVAGDERTTVSTFVPNTSAYIVDRLAREDVHAGKGAGGTLLSQQLLAYDGQASWGAAPVRGDKTLEKASLLDGAGAVIGTIVRWRGTYSAVGNLITETNAVGATKTYAYDAAQQLYRVSSTNALGHKTTLTWNPQCAAPTSTTDPNAAKTAWSYDTLCRPVRESRADGSFSNYAYINWGAPDHQSIVIDRSDGPTSASTGSARTQEYFDGMARNWRTETESDAGWAGPRRTVDVQYDKRGNMASRSAPYLAGGEAPRLTRYVYDAVNRLTRTTHPDGSSRTTVYGDWTEQHFDERDAWRKHWFDAYGRLAQTREHVGTNNFDTVVSHDLLGRRVRIVDALGNAMQTRYDSLGRKTVMADPDMGVWHYEHDAADRLIAQTDAKGQVLNMTYDALDRLVTRVHGTTELATLSYDQTRAGYANIGRLTELVDPSGRTVKNYDSLGRLAEHKQCISGQCFVIARSYDMAGRLRSLVYPNGEVVNHAYNAAGDLVRVGPYLVTASYDARGKLLARTFGNGVVERAAYDPDRFWLTRQWTERPDGTDLDAIAYTYDARGDITSKLSTRSADDWSYTYDDLRRLTAAVNNTDATLSESYVYDAIGRMQKQMRGAQTIDFDYPLAGAARPHAPIAFGARALTYDRNGNRLTDGTHTYRYDVQNRLVDDGVRTYVYDGQGERVKAGATLFVGKLYEKTGASWIQYYYAGDQRIARRDATGAVHYYHGDQIGSARLISQPDGAAAASRKLISPFGRVLSVAGGLDDPFGLAGERLDGSGLYQMGARYQDPELGQFTQPDPSADPDPLRPQSLNRYAYVHNNPVRLKDPTGYCAETGAGDANGGGEGGDANAEAGAQADAQAAENEAQRGPGESEGDPGQGNTGAAGATANDTGVDHAATADADPEAASDPSATAQAQALGHGALGIAATSEDPGGLGTPAGWGGSTQSNTSAKSDRAQNASQSSNTAAKSDMAQHSNVTAKSDLDVSAMIAGQLAKAQRSADKMNAARAAVAKGSISTEEYGKAITGHLNDSGWGVNMRSGGATVGSGSPHGSGMSGAIGRGFGGGFGGGFKY